MRSLTFLVLAALALGSTVRAQDTQSTSEQLPLAIALGARVTDRPQLALHLYPSERFEVAFSAYTNDWESGIGTNWYGSISALVRLRPEESLSFRLGANYTHDERARLEAIGYLSTGNGFQPYRWAGPLFGLDYALSDRLTAFADFVVGIDVDIQTVTMNNTGIGLLYRIKKM